MPSMVSFFRHIRVMTSILLLLVCSDCRPRKANTSSLRATAENCARVLTEPQQLELIAAASKIAAQSLSGVVSPESRNASTDKLIEAYGANAQKRGAAKALVALTSDFVASGWLLDKVFSWSDASSLSEPQLVTLESLGVARSLAWAYVSDVASWMRPFSRIIREYGFNYSGGGGWQFSGSDFHVDALRNSPELTAAFVSFFGASVTAGLASKDRSETIFLDGLALLPPNSAGGIAVWERSRWEAAVKRHLAVIAEQTERFIKSTKEASRYSNLMQGRILEWFGGERGLKGNTSAEIDVSDSYKIILSESLSLNTPLGVGPELRKQILELRKSLLEIESKNISEGLQRLDSATAAAIAAPFIPLVIWSAPFAGAAMGPAWAATIANASATMALIPLGFAAGSAAISATIKSATLGGSFLCNLYDEYTNKSSTALFAAPFMAAMPVVGALGSATVASATGGTVCAGTAYGTLNLGVSVYSVKLLGDFGIAGVGACYEELLNAEQASRGGDIKLVDLHASKAIQACVDAGIDLGFAMVQAGKLTVNAVSAIKQKNLKPLLGPNCMGLGGDGDCIPTAERSSKNRKAPAGVNELEPVSNHSERLHQNISVAERMDVIKNVPLDMVASSPGHDYLRSPQAVVSMAKDMAGSSDKGLAMFQSKSKMILNVYTNSQAKITGIEVTDGNHRFASGLYAEQLSAGKGWKTIGDIPVSLLDVRVNGFNTSGQKNPRWIPLHTVTEGSFPAGSWREVPANWGAQGPTAEVAGDLASTSAYFKPEHRGVSMAQVLKTSLERIGFFNP